MNKLLRLLVIITIAFLWSCNGKESSQTLLIATAANMQFAMEDLTQTFTRQTGIPSKAIFASSGKLYAQIQGGAPFDVFLSADQKYPEDLYRDGKTLAPPKTYAYGNLVLWTRVAGLEPTLDLLLTDRVKHIALANPKTAPYGRAAMEVLQKNNLWDQVQDKLVFGESIAQVNQFVTTQAAEMGFTALSVVKAAEIADKGKWMLLDTQHYSPIIQAVVLLNHDQRKAANAKKWEEFLLSSAGKEILHRFGYSTSGLE